MSLHLDLLGEDLRSIGERVAAGERLTRAEILSLWRTRDLNGLGILANAVRERLHGDRAYYVLNRHINYTNVCNKHCLFCSFARNPKDGGPPPYTLSADDVRERLRAHLGEPITEVHMVGGINPRLPYEYYLGLLEAIRETIPGVQIKAFTAVELDEIARVSGKPLEAVLPELAAAGLTAVPGGGAEVMSDRIHAELHPRKLDAGEWVRVSRQVAAAGLPQYATMLYGHIETVEERTEHLLRLRDLQDETGHFLAFTPLAFHPEGSYLEHIAPPTGTDDLRSVAVARLALDNFAHIKCFWIMTSAQVAQVSLRYGADDIDGTVEAYEITYPEGQMGRKQQVLTRPALRALIREVGRTPVERDTLYAERTAEGVLE